MPSIAATNALNPTPQFGQAEFTRQSGWESAATGLQNARLTDLYKNRTQPDYKASQGAQGNLYSGGAKEGSQRLSQDYQFGVNSNNFGLKHVLSNLSSQYLHNFLNVSV